VYLAGAVFLNGEEVQIPEGALGHSIHLPTVLRDY
jgi:hypothetical protein